MDTVGIVGGVVVVVVVVWLVTRERQHRHRHEFSWPGPWRGERGELPPMLAVDCRIRGVENEEVRRSGADATSSVEESAERIGQRQRFVIDGFVLGELFRYVTQDDRGEAHRGGFKEVFTYATGVRVDEHCFVVSHLVEVEFARQSAGGVTVADGSNISALAALDDAGLPLVCHAHSHPVYGSGGTRPSATDRSFQARLEAGGHVAIGLVFSRDGFVRFFAGDDSRFEVEVQGTNVERVEDNVYQVRLADEPVPVRVAVARRRW